MVPALNSHLSSWSPLTDFDPTYLYLCPRWREPTPCSAPYPAWLHFQSPSPTPPICTTKCQHTLLVQYGNSPLLSTRVLQCPCPVLCFGCVSQVAGPGICRSDYELQGQEVPTRAPQPLHRALYSPGTELQVIYSGKDTLNRYCLQSKQGEKQGEWEMWRWEGTQGGSEPTALVSRLETIG